MKYRIKIVLLVLFGLFFALIFPFLQGDVIGRVQAKNSTVFTTLSVDRQENTNNNPQSLLIKGIEAYEADSLTEAIAYWQSATAIFIRQNDLLSQALTQSYLSLAYQKLGLWQEADKSLQQGQELIQNLDRSLVYLEVEAKIYNAKASFYWYRGDLELALQNWDRAIENYQELDDFYGTVNAKINRAQTLQYLGFTVKARKELEIVSNSLKERTIEATELKQQLNQKLAGFRLLGSIYRRLGMLEESLLSLQQGLEIASSLSLLSELEQSKIFLELGNTERTIGNKYLTIGRDREEKQHHAAALDWYRQAIDKSSKIEPRLNFLSLSIELGKWQELDSIVKDIESKIAKIPSNRQSLMAELNFIRSLTCWQQISKLKDVSCLNLEFHDSIANKIKNDYLPNIPSYSWQRIGILLTDIQQKSRQLEDRHIEASATIQLGHLYEIDRQWQTAQNLTERALIIADELQSPELRYQSEWQLGRLREKQNDIKGAIVAYSDAVKTLKSVRQNIAFLDNNTLFSFQDKVEPVYRSLVDLLLKDTKNNNNLERAIETIDSFKLAELENFLGCKLNLLLRLDNNLEKIDPQAVLIYPIILDDRLEVIYQFPQQPIEKFTTNIEANTIKNTIELLRVALVRRDVSNIKNNSQKLYQWIFAPLASKLKQQPQIKNLIFISDSYLQTIPLTVLYDRDSQEYLLQKNYNIVNLPSTKVFQVKNKTDKFTVLGGGISKKIQIEDRTFNAIETDLELAKISNHLNTTILMNSEFTENNLSQNIQDNNYSIVHLATHGKFSSDPEETFLIIHSSFTEKGKILKVKDLDRIVRSNNINDGKKLELLVLSACQTALGDKRATLGLAGMTIASGANSSIGTLWQVSDESAIEFMDRFYQELAKPDINKAEAIRIAQQSLFSNPKYRNPYYWSPFILVGNWL
jgi:CHAT domain-containing protein